MPRAKHVFVHTDAPNTQGRYLGVDVQHGRKVRVSVGGRPVVELEVHENHEGIAGVHVTIFEQLAYPKWTEERECQDVKFTTYSLRVEPKEHHA